MRSPPAHHRTHLVLGFPFLFSSPLLFLALLPPLALHAPMSLLIVRVAVVLLRLLLPPPLVQLGRILRLLTSIVLQLSLFQLSILPAKQTSMLIFPLP